MHSTNYRYYGAAGDLAASLAGVIAFCFADFSAGVVFNNSLIFSMSGDVIFLRSNSAKSATTTLSLSGKIFEVVDFQIEGFCLFKLTVK